MNKIKSIIISSFILLGVIAPVVFAGTPPPMDPRDSGETDTSITQIGLASTSPIAIVLALVNFSLGLLGVASLILIIYAGFKWMLAAGEEEDIEEAQDILKGAVIGLVIILCSYGISRYVFDTIIDVSTTKAIVTPVTDEMETEER